MALQEIPAFSQSEWRKSKKTKELSFAPAERIQESFVAKSEKKALLLAGRAHARMDQFGSPYCTRLCGKRGGGDLLRPGCAGAGDAAGGGGMPGGELAGRQRGRHAGTHAQPAAAAVRLLRGPMHVNGIHFTFIYFWANSGRNGCGRRAPSLRSGFQQAARTPPKRRNFDSGMRPPVRQTQGLGLRPRLFSG